MMRVFFTFAVIAIALTLTTIGAREAVSEPVVAAQPTAATIDECAADEQLLGGRSPAVNGAPAWPEAAALAATPAAACHGTTHCEGTPGDNWRMLYCGDDSCTNQGCGKPDINPGRIRRQPREQARDWTTPDGKPCTEYRPYADFLTCTC